MMYTNKHILCHLMKVNWSIFTSIIRAYRIVIQSIAPNNDLDVFLKMELLDSFLSVFIAAILAIHPLKPYTCRPVTIIEQGDERDSN